MQRIAARCLHSSSFCIHHIRTCQIWPENFSHQRPSCCNHSPREVTLEADCTPILFFAALASAGAGLAWTLPKFLQQGSTKQVIEHIDIKDFKYRDETKYSVTYSYCGEDPRWCGTALRLRYDDCNAVAADRAAGLLLAETFVAHSELILVDAGDAAALDGRFSNVGQNVLALREAASSVPSDAHVGPVVTIHLRPGNGLGDLYGLPSRYSVQEDSSLLREKQARAGKYNARDIFSDRPERLRRALHALREDPQDILRIFMNESCVFPGELSSSSLADQFAELGLDGNGNRLLILRFLELLAATLEKEGRSLLMTLLRAQCSANAVTLDQARQLAEVLHQRASFPKEGSLTSSEALSAAFARGFWNLPADESGKSARERDGERLLERARRELWVEGSASRSELEAQVRTFLCRSLLGRAANDACVQLQVIKAKPDATGTLRDLRFFPVSLAPDMEFWCRLELAAFELPLEKTLRA